MIVIGLTGSIGMGKSVAAAMLRKEGVPVHEADAEVHELLRPRGKGAKRVAMLFPYAGYPEIYGRRNAQGIRPISRAGLGKLVFHNEKNRRALEKILHPLVREAQSAFIREAKAKGKKIVALDIPLLFETGRENTVDYTIVVTAPKFLQRERVLARPGMDEKKFRAILKTQMPDSEKRARADYVVHSGLGRAPMMKELKAVLRDIKERNKK
jgi:dephospho-CoA kinase